MTSLEDKLELLLSEIPEFFDQASSKIQKNEGVEKEGEYFNYRRDGKKKSCKRVNEIYVDFSPI